MNMFRCRTILGVGLASSCSAALAVSQDEALVTVTNIMLYTFIGFCLAVILGVYFVRSRDKRLAPLSNIFRVGESIHSVGPNASVADCVRLMKNEKIGALVVLEGEKLKGIFTERDALNRVLAANLDPASVKVSEVMTPDPFCVSPTTTIASAMAVVTTRRFRHLPIVEGGKLLAVVSSGDLTRWLISDQMGEVQELVELAAGS